MATAVETLLVSIQADVSQLKQGLTQAQTSLKGLDDTVKNTSSGFSQMTSKLKTLGATIGVAFGAEKVVSFFSESIMAASNFNEAFSKVGVVFGENATAIESWAKSAIDNFGMSERNALTAAGTFGNLFSAFGLGAEDTKVFSTSLTELAVDLASFNDMSVDESLNALRSGLSGETEPLKRFGIALSDTRLKTEAMALGLINSTKDALTPAAKSQAAYSLIMKDSAVAQGDYDRTAQGTANTMRRVAEKMDNAKVAIGQGLLPVFDVLLKVLEKGIVPVLSKMGDFLTKNKTMMMALGAAVTAGAVGFGLYKTVMLAVNAASKAHAVIQVLLKGGQLASIASTNTLAAAMLRLNAVMRANLIGIIVTAAFALVAVFVTLWNKSEAFRKIVVTLAKGVLGAVALMIKAWGGYMEILVKIITGPLKLFLGVLAKLPGVGGAAKKGLELIGKATEGIGDFADKAAAKVTGLGDKLDGLVKKQEKAAAATKTKVKAAAGGVDPAVAAEAAEKAKEDADKLKDYAKDVIDIYKDMNEVIAEANADAMEAAKDRDEAVAEANKRYSETVANLNKEYNEAVTEANSKYNETVTDLNKRYNEALADAQQRYDDTEANARIDYARTLAAEAKDYAKKRADLEEKLQSTLSSIRQKAADKEQDLIKSATDKQIKILQDGANKLRSAFSSGMSVNISDIFKTKGVGGITEALTKQIAGAKKLQANAAALAGKGYSQKFIEEVVKNGPEIGNQMADALLAAQPEQQQQLIDLYNSLDDISAHGVDQLADTLNNGLNFSTEEQMKAYNEVSQGLKQALSETTATLNSDLAQAQASHEAALAEAATASQAKIAEAKAKLDETMAEALAALQKSRAEAKKNLDEGLAEAQKVLDKTLADAKKRLDEGLAEAAKTLQEALIEAQKKYNEAVDKINADTEKKLKALKDKIAEVAAAMAALGAAQAAKDAMANAPVYTPIVASPLPTSTSTSGTGVTNNITTTVTGVNLTSPSETSNTIVTAIKFGNTVVPVAPSKLAAGESGAIGAASIKANTITLPSTLDFSWKGRVGR
jgi:hypothetical protein